MRAWIVSSHSSVRVVNTTSSVCSGISLELLCIFTIVLDGRWCTWTSSPRYARSYGASLLLRPLACS